MGLGSKDNSFDDLKTPAIEDMQVQLELLVQQGLMSPQQAQAMMQDPSMFEQISEDPSLRNAQLQALSELQDISSSGGMTAMDKAQLAEIQGNLNNQERGSREALMQNAQSRGVANSDMALAQQMLNQQQSAQRGSQQGMDVAAQAQQRALEAIMQSGQLGGQIRNQDFSQNAQKAQAQDMINQFNTQNKQNVNLANTQANNSAQQYNLDQRQNISNQNVGLRNQQQMQNKSLIQQDFDNRYKKAGGKSQANAANNATDQQTNQLIGGIGTAAMMASDRDAKEDIEEFEPMNFMDELTGYKYNYKSPEKHGEGEQVGVMSQDLKKVAPQAVSEDEEGTERIDYNKLGGPILASLAELNDRIKKIEGK